MKSNRKIPGVLSRALGHSTRLAAMTPEMAPLAPMTGSGDASAVATNAMAPKNPLARYRPRYHHGPNASSTASPKTYRNHMFPSRCTNPTCRNIDEPTVNRLWTVISAWMRPGTCLLYTSDAADDLLCVDLGGRRIIKKKKKKKKST